jgi:PAS domain-containing protein
MGRPSASGSSSSTSRSSRANNRVGTLYLKERPRGPCTGGSRVYGAVLFGVLIGSVLLAYLLSNFLQKQISSRSSTWPRRPRSSPSRRTTRCGRPSRAATSWASSPRPSTPCWSRSSSTTPPWARARSGSGSWPTARPSSSGSSDVGPAGDLVQQATGSPSSARTMAEEVGDGWIESSTRRTASRCLAASTPAFEQRQYFRLECRLRRHDGEYRWLLNQGTPRYQGGEFAGFIGSCVDITDNKEAEASVRSSELQMRLVTDNASVYLCEITTGSTASSSSTGPTRRRYGLEPRTSSGAISPTSSAQPGSTRRSAEASTWPFGGAPGVRGGAELSDPGRRWIHAIYEPESARRTGKSTAIVAVLTDITDRRQVAHGPGARARRGRERLAGEGRLPRRALPRAAHAAQPHPPARDRRGEQSRTSARGPG